MPGTLSATAATLGTLSAIADPSDGPYRASAPPLTPPFVPGAADGGGVLTATAESIATGLVPPFVDGSAAIPGKADKLSAAAA